MKALTIRQPWASLIALGVKHIETRSWRAPQSLIGQTIAIHAGKAALPPGGTTIGKWHIDHDRTAAKGSMYRLEFDWIVARSLPLGAVVATATLADCLPIESLDEDPSDESLEHGHVIYVRSDPAWAGWALESYRHEAPPHDIDVSDQFPYGDFQPGRWAWMLTDVQPCDPVPAKGKQGLWEWQP